VLKIGKYDIIHDGTAISSTKRQLSDSLEKVQTCPVCCEVTTRSTKVGYLMYLGTMVGADMPCCEGESLLLA
jgi:hypothetical protein